MRKGDSNPTVLLPPAPQDDTFRVTGQDRRPSQHHATDRYFAGQSWRYVGPRTDARRCNPITQRRCRPVCTSRSCTGLPVRTARSATSERCEVRRNEDAARLLESFDDGLRRFDRLERFVHWTNATLFFVLIATGAALYIAPLSTLVARRELMKTIHVWAGYLLPIPVLLALLLPAGRQFRRDIAAKAMSFSTH